jgi:hypothetical protein
VWEAEIDGRSSRVFLTDLDVLEGELREPRPGQAIVEAKLASLAALARALGAPAVEAGVERVSRRASYAP